MTAVLHTAFWTFVLVLALSFFGISIQAIISSPAGQENFGYLAHLALALWHGLSHWFAAASHP